MQRTSRLDGNRLWPLDESLVCGSDTVRYEDLRILKGSGRSAGDANPIESTEAYPACEVVKRPFPRPLVGTLVKC